MSENVIYEHKKAEEVKDLTQGIIRDSSETPLIFCIDISSSMQCSELLNGKWFTYLTRYDCIAKGICDQIEACKETKSKVCYCAWRYHCETSCNRFRRESQCRRVFVHKRCSACSKIHMSHPISHTHKSIIDLVKNKEPNGSTTLGLGALTAITMAGAVGKGATVVIRTDGEANTGVGSQDSYKDVSDCEQRVLNFYKDLADNANKHGVTVNLMSLKECYCNLDNLIVLSEETGGQVNIIDPQDASNVFETMLQVKPIAINVTVKVRLHQALEFKNELGKNLSADRTLMKKKLGSVNSQTEVTFGYKLKDPDKLALIEGFNIEEFSKIPFQTQIEYCRLDDTKCLKVISRVFETSSDAEEIKQDANLGIVAVSTAQQASNLVKREVSERLKYFHITTRSSSKGCPRVKTTPLSTRPLSLVCVKCIEMQLCIEANN
ncbi:unnamed protein product [Moneuplotes crassus]|uniref:VWFA domain-containing protein n=1 Tax=Euplotes crassus TaxID=5936 RepID=A0AAD1U449_EUPCR|nr:unnamed protein product [Moneuplotes crassus]